MLLHLKIRTALNWRKKEYSCLYSNNTCHYTYLNCRRKRVPMFCAPPPPLSDEYNVTTLEKPVVKIYVWVSISLAFHSIVQQKWEQSEEEKEKAKRLFDLQKIRNKSLTSDIIWASLLLQLVDSCSNCKPRFRCQEKIQKSALNDLYLSLYDVEYSKASKNFLKTRGNMWIYFQCPINLLM